MSKELKYPIKYAVLELKEQGGWLNGYEDITQGFIVSKCYVVESRLKHFSSGKSELTHNVVFPYKNIANFRLALQRGVSYCDTGTIPSYDACGNPYPADVVSNLFDSYEEAQLSAFESNETLKRRLILQVSISDEDWREKYAKLQQELSENLTLCQKFETFISAQTETMNVSDNCQGISYQKTPRP